MYFIIKEEIRWSLKVPFWHALFFIRKMILVLKAQMWSYFSCYDCNFLSSFSFAGADKCFDACETTPFCPDFYTCVLPNSNMAISSAIINHTYKWMAFKRVCLSIMEWNIFVAVFLKGCLSCDGCFKTFTCIVNRIHWLFLCCQNHGTYTRLAVQEPVSNFTHFSVQFSAAILECLNAKIDYFGKLLRIHGVSYCLVKHCCLKSLIIKLLMFIVLQGLILKEHFLWF